MRALLGISCDYHDSAAAVLVDGEIAAAAEEERFTRVKHDASLPSKAVEACLRSAGVTAGELDAVVFHEKPLDVLARVLATRQRQGPRSFPTFAREMPALLGRNLMVGRRIDRMLHGLGASRSVPTVYSEHHLSHAAAAFLPSPFETAAILTIDGVGEWATCSIGRGHDGTVGLIEEIRFPHSLGLLYSLVTVWCGFRPNDGEYKVMGLAPFGSPVFADRLSELLTIHDSGAFEVDARRLRWWSDPRRNRSLRRLLDGPPRRSGDPLTQREADLAASVQLLTERAVLGLAERARRLTGEKRLCLAGGVALNVVANGRLSNEGPFDEVWIQPAAGDSGSAIGAALWQWHRAGNERVPSVGTMSGAALGPSYTPDEITEWLRAADVEHQRLDGDKVAVETAERLRDGQIVGWFEGRMEFGPRALGHRSILADPRSRTVQAELNERIKGREGFRPFAPSVPVERAAEWFDLAHPSPFMLFTAPVTADRMVDVDGDEPATFSERVAIPRSELPACTHVDGSARVQTVDRDTHPAFHSLLSEFGRLTGCPVLLNTSFNVADEPIVCTPDDALDTARRAGLDALVIEDHVIDLRAAG